MIAGSFFSFLASSQGSGFGWLARAAYGATGVTRQVCGKQASGGLGGGRGGGLRWWVGRAVFCEAAQVGDARSSSLRKGGPV